MLLIMGVMDNTSHVAKMFQLLLSLCCNTYIYMAAAQIGIIMGSESDLKVMNEAAEVLRELGAVFELTVVSAHRTPDRMRDYAVSAAERGLKVIIAGAGGAAHLPGMVASYTTLPVIGVPIKSSNSIDGWDSVLSILQMPSGVPVATVALNGAKNAGILAAQILATSDKGLTAKLVAYKKQLSDKVENSIREIKIAGYDNGFDQ
jgi:5-(carboxyamino)imidazole ribonucleotide mutase